MEIPSVNADTPVPPYEQWPSLPTGESGENGSHAEKREVMDLGRIMSSTERDEKSPAAFSMDDLEVAKALTGLREASPAQSITTVASRTMAESHSPRTSTREEPLLSLLTSQHPLVATAINNSLSAYSTSKSYSPRFRQGAEYVERNIASPIATTVGTAGRISGVETGVRWWLQRNDSGGSNSGSPAAGSNKRRRLGSNDADVERGPAHDHVLPHRSRAPSDMSQLSQPETLPAYDENRSPVYEEYAVVPATPEERARQGSGALSQKWQTRLMLSTSGLGVAMSDESLRSLKYCLSWLRWANTHLNRVLSNLQAVLYEWERSQQPPDDSSSFASSAPSSPLSPSFPASRTPSVFSLDTHHHHHQQQQQQQQQQQRPPPRDPATITANINALKGECVRTLKSALDVVSTYAGGALPENARILVRRHLTSLPLRFRLASTNGSGGSGSGSGSRELAAPDSADHSRNASCSADARTNGQVPGGLVDGNGSGSIDGGESFRSGSVDTEAQSRHSEAVSGAKRVVVLAREGLDMMAQVSAVVDGTIVSAEEWCERLGRKRQRGASGSGSAIDGGREGAKEKQEVRDGDAEAAMASTPPHGYDRGDADADMNTQAAANGDDGIDAGIKQMHMGEQRREVDAEHEALPN